MKADKNIPSHLDRRQFLKIVAVAGAVGAGWTFGRNQGAIRYKRVQKSQPMMGTVLNLTLYGPDQSALEEAIEATIDRMLHLENLLSRHDEQSELATLNRTGTLLHPNLETRNVFELAGLVHEKTEGAFDVTVLPLVRLQQGDQTPDKQDVENALSLTGFQHLVIEPNKIAFTRPGMGVTLDGIGKGYIVDQGVEILQQSGFGSTYVEAGGDLMVTGRKPGDAPWRIGIKNPRPSDSQSLVIIQTTNQAVATSGDYMQAYDTDFSRHHIVNPLTGYSPPELASATIVAPTVALADALATAAMVMGQKKSIQLLNTLPDCEGYFIDKQLAHFKSSGFSV